ncbi:MAG: hypothetical protein VX543_01665, partial [Cyanobacteriota bacterium]|nr:hypothetical protein [Cyanobacteriota bacterium]
VGHTREDPKFYIPFLVYILALLPLRLIKHTHPEGTSRSSILHSLNPSLIKQIERFAGANKANGGKGQKFSIVPYLLRTTSLGPAGLSTDNV